jgi:GT2 family glycosyltransferase
MAAPRITACIVVYKSNLEDVFRSVESLYACTLPIDILVVDNHSGAEYYALLTQKLAAFEDVVVMDSGANKGFGAGHNIGFKSLEDESDVHIVVNPDIIVHRGAIEAMVAKLDENPEIGLIAPKIVDEHGNLQHLCRRFPSVLVLFGRRFMPRFLLDTPFMIAKMDTYHMRDKNYDDIMEPQCISGCFMMFRSDIFRELMGFDEHFFLYFEDNDITLRARKICTAVYYPKATVTHTWKGGARQSIRLTKLQIQSAFKFYRKWGWKFY